MDQLTPAVRDEHEDVQRVERQPLDGQQVSRPDARSMVGEEGPPGLARRAIRTMPAVAPDRAVADRDAEFEQLTTDPLDAPPGILLCKPDDEFPNIASD